MKHWTDWTFLFRNRRVAKFTTIAIERFPHNLDRRRNKPVTIVPFETMTYYKSRAHKNNVNAAKRILSKYPRRVDDIEQPKMTGGRPTKVLRSTETIDGFEFLRTDVAANTPANWDPAHPEMHPQPTSKWYYEGIEMDTVAKCRRLAEKLNIVPFPIAPVTATNRQRANAKRVHALMCMQALRNDVLEGRNLTEDHLHENF